ncbi:Thioredoxin superfamily protein [Quillaja saponaria]|uniref:Thioredoxin superfamily protein n=1 Tax=Quillaja saponaria TaxID=32244 RepID=A0AAD7PSF5_QUISA|nr:Thioredoxin superfamily protein [Quillaja saponaria]
MATAVSVSSVSGGLVHLPLKFAAVLPTQFVPACLFSKLGFHYLKLHKNLSPRKLVVRAARTESKGLSLGFRAPDFQLPEPLTGKVWKLEDFEAYPALLVMFICNHCPFVKHLKKDIVKLANFYTKKGLAVIAISSNSIATHPQDGPEFMAEEAKLFNYPFPYLYDEDGRRPFELVYHGQFDDSRPSSNVPVTGRDLSLAIDRVLSGQPVSSAQKPSVPVSLLRISGSTEDNEMM